METHREGAQGDQDEVQAGAEEGGCLERIAALETAIGQQLPEDVKESPSSALSHRKVVLGRDAGQQTEEVTYQTSSGRV